VLNIEADFFQHFSCGTLDIELQTEESGEPGQARARAVKGKRWSECERVTDFIFVDFAARERPGFAFPRTNHNTPRHRVIQ
jgi:hypothetical protein